MGEIVERFLNNPSGHQANTVTSNGDDKKLLLEIAETKKQLQLKTRECDKANGDALLLKEQLASRPYKEDDPSLVSQAIEVATKNAREALAAMTKQRDDWKKAADSAQEQSEQWQRSAEGLRQKLSETVRGVTPEAKPWAVGRAPGNVIPMAPTVNPFDQEQEAELREKELARLAELKARGTTRTMNPPVTSGPAPSPSSGVIPMPTITDAERHKRALDPTPQPRIYVDKNLPQETPKPAEKPLHPHYVPPKEDLSKRPAQNFLKK